MNDIQNNIQNDIISYMDMMLKFEDKVIDGIKCKVSSFDYDKNHIDFISYTNIDISFDRSNEWNYGYNLSNKKECIFLSKRFGIQKLELDINFDTLKNYLYDIGMIKHYVYNDYIYYLYRLNINDLSYCIFTSIANDGIGMKFKDKIMLNSPYILYKDSQDSFSSKELSAFYNSLHMDFNSNCPSILLQKNNMYISLNEYIDKLYYVGDKNDNNKDKNINDNKKTDKKD